MLFAFVDDSNVVSMQPLHVGFASDKGGNTIDVHWYRRKQVLHHVSPNCQTLSKMPRPLTKKLNVVLMSILTDLGCQYNRDSRGKIVQLKRG